MKSDNELNRWEQGRPPGRAREWAFSGESTLNPSARHRPWGLPAAACLAAAALLAAPAGARSAAPPRDNTAQESQIGREVSAEIDASAPLSADSSAVARLQRIADALAPLTDRPLIRYRVQLIDSPIPNAFAIPGGYIYFTSGLLRDARSDDELAGVMAHEIAHNERQHAITRMQRGSTRALRIADLLSLGVLLATGGGEWGQAARLGVGALTQSVLNAYSIEDETDADDRALRTLVRSPYNPVGFLTFMERMASVRNQVLEEEMGIFRTHPFSGDRVLRARKFLEDRGIPLKRRPVNGAPAPRWGLAERGGEKLPALLYEGSPLFFVAAPDSGDSRVGETLDALRLLLNREVPADSMWVEAGAGGGAALVAAAGRVAISAEDARVNAAPAESVASRLRDSLEGIRQRDRREVGLIYYLIGSEKKRNP